MSIGLSQEDIEVMLRISRRYGADDDSALLPWDLCYDLQELIACDSLTVALHGSPGQAVDAWQTTPEDEDDEPADEVFWAHFWDSLDCSYPDRSGDLVSVTLTSDFYSERAYRNTGMYVDYDSRVGVEHEIRVCLPAGPGRSLRLLWSRGPGPNFTERDRAVLTLLRPHLQSAYVNAERRRRGIAPLTDRQREILQYVAAGLTNRQIARQLGLSEGTVRKHLENIFARLSVTSRTAAAHALRDDSASAELGVKPQWLTSTPPMPSRSRLGTRSGIRS